MPITTKAFARRTLPTKATLVASSLAVAAVGLTGSDSTDWESDLRAEIRQDPEMMFDAEASGARGLGDQPTGASPSGGASSATPFVNVEEVITPEVYYGFQAFGFSPLDANGDYLMTEELASRIGQAWWSSQPTKAEVRRSFSPIGHAYQNLHFAGMPDEQIARIAAVLIYYAT